MEAGAKDVFLIEEPIAAAIEFFGIEISQPNGRYGSRYRGRNL